MKKSAWRKVVFPLVKPGIGAVAVFAFLSGWGEWILAFTYLRTARWYTLPVILYRVTGQLRFVDWGFLAALGYVLPSAFINFLHPSTEDAVKDSTGRSCKRLIDVGRYFDIAGFYINKIHLFDKITEKLLLEKTPAFANCINLEILRRDFI